MDIFNKINSLDILSVLDVANISYKKDSGQPHNYTILKSDGRPDNSFKVNTSKNIAVDFGWDGIKWWPFDIIGRLHLNQDTKTKDWQIATVKWFIDKWLVENPKNNIKFEKSHDNTYLLENFEKFRLGWYKDDISQFLMWRWVGYDWIQKNHLLIWEVFTEIWFYDKYFTKLITKIII